MNEVIYCDGCGAKLQTENKNELGYIPKITQKEMLFCQRCFKIRHYNENTTVNLDSEDYAKVVKQIKKTKSLIVHLIDLFDVDATLLSNLTEFTGHNEVILVANKLDLLPKSLNHRRVKNWLKNKIKEKQLNVSDIHLISAKKGHEMDALAVQLEKARLGKDIYVVGVTNVGKSTFINQFIQRSEGISDIITTSYFPGTTLDFIHIPLDETHALVDTPGIINEEQLSHYVAKQDLKKITPKKEVKSRNYQLNEAQSIFIGGFIRMDFVSGPKQSFVFYCSNELPLHRTKLENADKLMAEQLGDLLKPPSKETIEQLPTFKAHTFNLNKNVKTDIVISGLGWITVQDKGQIIIHAPENVGITLRDSILNERM